MGSGTDSSQIQLSQPVGPPELPYSLRDRKKSIAIVWTFIILDSCVAPVALFYGIHFGSNLSTWVLFTISTSVFGLLSVIEYVRRFWLLIRKDPWCRPVGSKRIYLDCFQWSYSIGFVLVTALLVWGTTPQDIPVRVLAMPPLALMFFTGFQLLLFNIFHLKGVKAPFRISSTLKGAPIKAPLFAIIEDAIAVDGHGGYPYREALTARYEASPMFRQMLVSLTFFWSISAITVAAASTAVIFTVPVTVAYGIGWTVPFIWAGIWTAITIKFVQSSLRKEKAAWRGEPKA